MTFCNRLQSYYCAQNEASVDTTDYLARKAGQPSKLKLYRVHKARILTQKAYHLDQLYVYRRTKSVARV